MKKIAYMLGVFALMLTLNACRHNVPEVEELPRQKIDFTYEDLDAKYPLDFYVGSRIKFYPTVPIKEGTVEWDFGDTTMVGDTVIYKFKVAGNYKVTAKGNGGKKTNVIYISDIRPIISVGVDPATWDEGLVLVKQTYVSLLVELPNPDSLNAEYRWHFPAGTTDENDLPVAELVQKYSYVNGVWTPDVELNKVKFARVGSQTASLDVLLAGRPLENVKKNVQVAMNVSAPTLYYAAANGNIMAIKIYPQAAEEGIAIDPFDMGVSSGTHPFTLLYHEGYIYHFDAGKQFTFVNDADSVKGDGKIQIIAVDASSVETMFDNNGGYAFRDPFYGCIEGTSLYYSDRNTGLIEIPLTMRNSKWSWIDCKYFVQNNRLGYYGVQTAYGAITANAQCIHLNGQADGTWFWSKTYAGSGIYRWKKSDILDKPTTGDPTLIPASGSFLVNISSIIPKAFCYDAKNDIFYFAAYGAGEGFYGGTFAQLEAITDANNAKPYMKTFANGAGCPQITQSGKGEGSEGEFIGITELALDEETGDVYFCLRSGNKAEAISGVKRYNRATDKLENFVDNVDAYGCCINPVKTKLY